MVENNMCTVLLEVLFPHDFRVAAPAQKQFSLRRSLLPTPNSLAQTAAGDHRGAGPRSSKASDAGGVGDVGGGAGEEAVARGLADGGAGIHPRPWRRCAPPGRGRPARRLLRARPRHPLLHRRLHFPGTAGLLHHHRLARRDREHLLLSATLLSAPLKFLFCCCCLPT